MDRGTLHRIGKYAPWPPALAVLVVTPLAYAGAAQPYVGVPPRFAGDLSPLVVMTAAVAGAAALSNLFRNSEWVRAGREAGFAPTGMNPVSRKRPELSGTVDGREVRIASRDYATAFKAVLEREATEGVVVGPADEEEATLAPFAVADDADVSAAGLVAVESAEGSAAPVLSGRSRERLADHDRLHQVYVGDLTAVYEMPERESGAGREFDVRWDLFRAHQDDYDGRDTWVGDSSTVSHVVPGIVTDPERLQYEARTVAAVAEAFERRIARPG